MEEIRIFKLAEDEMVVVKQLKTNAERACEVCAFYDGPALVCDICKNCLQHSEYPALYLKGLVADMLSSLFDGETKFKYGKFVNSFLSEGEKLISLPTNSFNGLLSIARKLNNWIDGLYSLPAGQVEALLLECNLSLKNEVDLSGYYVRNELKFEEYIEKLENEDVYWFNIPIFHEDVPTEEIGPTFEYMEDMDYLTGRAIEMLINSQGDDIDAITAAIGYLSKRVDYLKKEDFNNETGNDFN